MMIKAAFLSEKRIADVQWGAKCFMRGGDRVFQNKNQWYVNLREGIHGDFPTREAAELWLDDYVIRQVSEELGLIAA